MAREVSVFLTAKLFSLFVCLVFFIFAVVRSSGTGRQANLCAMLLLSLKRFVLNPILN